LGRIFESRSEEIFEWLVNQPYKTLVENIPKHYNRVLTIVTSHALFADGHQKRVNFLHFLENNFNEVSNNIGLHIWGEG
jgi:hypothetical protein